MFLGNMHGTIVYSKMRLLFDLCFKGYGRYSASGSLWFDVFVNSVW